MQVFSFTDWLNTGGLKGLSSATSSFSYQRNCWVYAAINRIALTAASAPLQFFENKKATLPSYRPEELIIDSNHPVLRLFNPPNYPIIVSLRDLIYRTFLHLGVDGKVFWVLKYEKSIPVSIDLAHKNSLLPLFSDPATRKNLIGWSDTATGKTHVLNEVILFQEYFPNLTGGASLDGLSPLGPARASLEAELQINGWNSSFFKTGMKTPLLLQAKGRLTSEQKKEIREEIVNYYSGIDGAHGALILQGGITVTPLTVGTKDVDFINGKKLNREEILAVYGVPPSMVGLFEYSSYANAVEQTRTFWEQTLLPKMSAMLDLIQVNILNQAFPGVYARWDFSQVAGLKPDPITLATPAKTYVDMGYHPKQVARIFDFDKLYPDKDFGKLALERQRQQLAYQQALQTLRPATDPNPPNADKPKSSEMVENYIKSIADSILLYTYMCEQSDDHQKDELFDLLVVSGIKDVLLSKNQYKPELLDVIMGLKQLSLDFLRDHAQHFSTILLSGIYSPEKRN